jgi:hypothetical protein
MILMEIAKTREYSISVEPEINRINLTVTGFWGTPSDVPNYLSDIERAISRVTRGFTVLADFVQMMAPGLGVERIHETAQRILVSSGLSKTAEVRARGAASSTSVDRYSKTLRLEKKLFDDRSQAEMWLAQ